jgi:hypothetical protein
VVAERAADRLSALAGRAPWQTCVMRSDGSHRRCFRHRGWQEYQRACGRDAPMLPSHRVNLTSASALAAGPRSPPTAAGCCSDVPTSPERASALPARKRSCFAPDERRVRLRPGLAA